MSKEVSGDRNTQIAISDPVWDQNSRHLKTGVTCVCSAAKQFDVSKREEYFSRESVWFRNNTTIRSFLRFETCVLT